MSKKEIKYTVQRLYEAKGGKVELIHTLELAKPYLCTYRLPGRSQESSFACMTDSFTLAHKTYERFVKQLKSFIPVQNT